jgi:hypothetical protein
MGDPIVGDRNSNRGSPGNEVLIRNKPFELIKPGPDLAGE